MKVLFLFIMIAGFSNAQSKKEQIEQLRLTIDSLNVENESITLKNEQLTRKIGLSDLKVTSQLSKIETLSNENTELVAENLALQNKIKNLEKFKSGGMVKVNNDSIYLLPNQEFAEVELIDVISSEMGDYYLEFRNTATGDTISFGSSINKIKVNPDDFIERNNDNWGGLVWTGSSVNVTLDIASSIFEERYIRRLVKGRKYDLIHSYYVSSEWSRAPCYCDMIYSGNEIVDIVDSGDPFLIQIDPFE